jgi:hypothetical protein
VLDKRDVDRMARVSETERCFLQQRCRNWLQNRPRDTILMQYSSDVTPLLTRERYSHTIGGHSVMRAGRASNEFLIQRCFMSDLMGSAVCLFEKPLSMAKKTAFAHFAAYRSFIKTPREQGHVGLHVIAHTYDRAIQRPVSRLHRQWQALRDDKEEEELHAGSSYRLWLQSWFVSMGCFAHDCHGGLKWSVLSQFQDKGCMRSCFITVEALRNSNDLLMKHVAPWIMSTLQFDDWDNPERRQLYMAFDCEPHLLDELDDLEIRFSSGRLLVAERHRGEDGLIDRLVHIMLMAWGFRKWSESRWLSLGSSCRSLALSMLLGVDSLVGYIIQAGESKYHLGGFTEHLTDQVKGFMAVVAISSRVPDALLTMMMNDDRLPMQIDSIDEELADELGHISHLPNRVWQELASVFGLTWHQLRSDCMAASLTAAGYIQSKLRQARKGVWQLLRGDRRQNILDLAKTTSPPDDEVMFKIWELMRLGFGINLCLEGLAALSKVSWTTLSVEQGHASASGLMKMHREYGRATLMARSMIMQFQPLLRELPEERRLREAEKQYDTLGRKQPQRINGRHLFIKELNMMASQYKSQGKQVPKDVSRQIIKNHGKRWALQEPSVQSDYHRRAEETRQEADQDLQVRRDMLATRIETLRVQVTTASATEGPLRLTSCRLSETEKLELENIFASELFSAAHVEGWREADQLPFEPPNDAVRLALESVEVGWQSPIHPYPSWVPSMCWNRAFFATCGLLVEEPEGETYWKVCYAMQNPYLVCLVGLDPLETAVPWAEPPNYEEAFSKSWEHTFEVAINRFRWSDEGHWKSEWPVFVLPDVRHEEGKVVADGRWLLLDKIVAKFPPVPAAKPKGEQTTTRTSDIDCPFSQYPWLDEFLKTGKASRSSPSSGAAGTGASSSSSGACAPTAAGHDYQDVVDAEVVMDALLRKRVELGLTGTGGADFAVVMKGGVEARSGRAYQEVVGRTCNSAVEGWCVQWHMQKSFSATLGTYDESVAMVLARAWVNKMQFLFDMHEAEGSNVAFSHDALRDFPEDAEVSRLFDTGSAATKSRIAAIRRMRPHQ